MQMKNGEFTIDKLDLIEDTKGNAGDTGRLIVTNLRIIWHCLALPRINLSIGFNTFVAVNTKSIHSGIITQSLHILTSFRGSRYEFIFTNLDPRSSRHYTSVTGVYRAYVSSKIYREIKLRGGIIHENRLNILPNENVHTTLPAVWNLSTEQGNVGTFIVTNIRLVWFADMNHRFNVSLPYLTLATVAIRNSKFGQTLVITSTEASGGYLLGFRVDPLEKLYSLHKEIKALSEAYKKAPIFGVEYTLEHQAASVRTDFDTETSNNQGDAHSNNFFTNDNDQDQEISDVLGLYFSEGGSNQRKPNFSNYLGLAVEDPREGSSLQNLWELVPTTS